MCTDLEAMLGDRVLEVDQVKEKFGTLRFYASIRGGEKSLAVDAADQGQIAVVICAAVQQHRQGAGQRPTAGRDDLAR